MKLISSIARSWFARAARWSAIGACIGAVAIVKAEGPAAIPAKTGDWTVPDINTLPDNAWGKLVREGRDQVVATYDHLGPEATDPARAFSGNNMACQNCHLEAGTKKFALPFVGAFADFPQYRAREGEVGTLEDRVNGCLTRSMNGRPLAFDSHEMKAFVAYIKFLSDGRPVGGKTTGRGTSKIAELTHPADPVAGAKVFIETCAACHGDGGLGKRAGVDGDRKGYEFPPLAGPDSFNDGAGMARLITAAEFIHSNMPNGASYDQPVLSETDAWNVAAFVESMQRPHKADLDKDYPFRTEKPVDAPYGPYADGFDTNAHKYGPFGPIRDKLKAMSTANAPASTR
jgi:thiosulfate dehydrogenase